MTRKKRGSSKKKKRTVELQLGPVVVSQRQLDAESRGDKPQGRAASSIPTIMRGPEARRLDRLYVVKSSIEAELNRSDTSYRRRNDVETREAQLLAQQREILEKAARVRERQSQAGKKRAGANRERDAAMVKTAKTMRESGKIEKEIRADLAERFGMTTQRVGQILKASTPKAK